MPAYHFGVESGADHPPGRARPRALETYLGVFVGTGVPPEEPALVVMWGATFPSDSPLPAAVHSDRQTHRDLGEAIRAGQQDGSIRADLDADAAALVMGMARGIAALSLAHPGAGDPFQNPSLLCKVITTSLQNPNPTVPPNQETPTISRRTSRPS